MPFPPSPYLITSEEQRMVWELILMGMRPESGVSTHDHVIQAIVRLAVAVRNGVKLSDEQKDKIRGAYAKVQANILPDERIINPPPGYPGYEWPEGTEVHPYSYFMPEWAKNAVWD